MPRSWRGVALPHEHHAGMSLGQHANGLTSAILVWTPPRLPWCNFQGLTTGSARGNKSDGLRVL